MRTLVAGLWRSILLIANRDALREGLIGMHTCTTLGTALVGIAHLTLGIICPFRRKKVFFVVAVEFHVVRWELERASLAHIRIRCLTLWLLQRWHERRNGEPHDKANEEVPPCKMERPGMRPRELAAWHNLAGGRVKYAAGIIQRGFASSAELYMFMRPTIYI